MAKQNLSIEAQSTSKELKERQYIYNGDTVGTPNVTLLRPNRPASRRRSPMKWTFLLILLSLVVVLYIWNKFMVDRLTEEIANLEKQHQQITNTNEFLRAEINKKSQRERIEKIAVEQLGLSYPQEQPIWFQLHRQKWHTTPQ